MPDRSPNAWIEAGESRSHDQVLRGRKNPTGAINTRRVMETGRFHREISWFGGEQIRRGLPK
jgi:hypothetical protein